MNENLTTTAPMFPKVAPARTQNTEPAGNTAAMDPLRFAAILTQAMEETPSQTKTEAAVSATAQTQLGEGLVVPTDPQETEDSSVELDEVSSEMATEETKEALSVSPYLMDMAAAIPLVQPPVESVQASGVTAVESLEPMTAKQEAGLRMEDSPVELQSEASQETRGKSFPQVSAVVSVGATAKEGVSSANVSDKASSRHTGVTGANSSNPPTASNISVDTQEATVMTETPLESDATHAQTEAAKTRAKTNSLIVEQTPVIPWTELAARSVQTLRGMSGRQERAGVSVAPTPHGAVVVNLKKNPATVSTASANRPQMDTASWMQRFTAVQKAVSGALSEMATVEGQKITGYESLSDKGATVSSHHDGVKEDTEAASEAQAFPEESPANQRSSPTFSFEQVLKGTAEAEIPGAGENMVLPAEIPMEPAATNTGQMTAPASSETLYTPKGVMYTTEDVVSQIIKGARVATHDGAVEMKLRLDPEELGRVELKIVYERNVINTQFVAESETVKRIIETHLPQLRNALQESGVHADNFSVTVNNGWSSPGNGQSGQDNRPFHHRSPNYKWQETGEDQEPLITDAAWLGRINLKA